MLQLLPDDQRATLSPTPPRLSVIIPTFNGRKLLQQCLPTLELAIARARWTTQTEILAVDDHSSDDTQAWLKANRPAVRLIQNTGFRGFAGAVNAGLHSAHGEWIALVNNDVLIDEQWLLSAIPHFQQPQIGSVATRIMVGGQAGIAEFAGGEYTPVGIPLRLGQWAAVDKPGIMQPRLCFWGCGAAVFYRRAALADVGGELYAGLEAYQEDVELAFRLALAGWNCVYEPASWVEHLGSMTYGTASFRKKFNSARNAEIVYFSCMPTSLLLRYLPLHCVAFVPQLAGHVIRGTAWGYFCGKAAFFLAHIPATWRRRTFVQKLRKVAPNALRRKLWRRWLSAVVGIVLPARQPK